jgi:hypothetical protein
MKGFCVIRIESKGYHIFLLPLRADYPCSDSLTLSFRTCFELQTTQAGPNAAWPRACFSLSAGYPVRPRCPQKNMVSLLLKYVFENELVLRFFRGALSLQVGVYLHKVVKEGVVFVLVPWVPEACPDDTRLQGFVERDRTIVNNGPGVGEEH